jgi:drug/metabolite transporter (DMT)-like permease
MSRFAASLLVLLAASIWGTGFYFQKTAMDHLGPLQFLGFRGLLASMALAPFAWIEARKNKTPLRAAMPLALAGGLVFFTAGVLQQNGLFTATVTNTGFLTALYVVITPLLLWALMGQKPSAKLWLAVLLASCGIWALGGGSTSAFSTGDMLIALSAIFWSLYMVITSKAASHAKPMQITFLVFVILAVLGWGSALALEDINWASSQAAAPSILYVGLLASAVCYAIIAMAVRYIPATHASILLSTETLFSAAAGHVMLGERLGSIGWVGAALLLLAVVLVQWKGTVPT